MAENTDLTVLLDRILTTKNELRDIIDTEEIDFTQLPSMIYNWLVDQYNSAWVDGYNQAWYEIFNSHVSKTGPLTHIEFTPPEIPDYPDYDYDILTQIMNECLLSRRDIRDVLHLTGDDKDLFETYPDYLRAEFARMSTNGYDDGYAQAYADAPGYGILPPNIQCNNNIVTITPRTEGQEVWYKVGEYGVFGPYEGPFEIDRDTTVFAYSKDGNGESIVISKTFYFSVVLAPTIDQSMNVVSIIAADPTDRLFYTTDGRDPAHYGVEYTSPIHITSTTIIKAVAFNGQIYSNLTTKLCTYYKNADKPFTVTALGAGSFIILYETQFADGNPTNEIPFYNINASNSYIRTRFMTNAYFGSISSGGIWNCIVIDGIEAGDTFEIRLETRFRQLSNTSIQGYEEGIIIPIDLLSTFNYNVSGNIASLFYEHCPRNDYEAPPSNYWFCENKEWMVWNDDGPIYNHFKGYVNYFDTCNPIIYHTPGAPNEKYYKRTKQNVGLVKFEDLVVTQANLSATNTVDSTKYVGYSGTRGVVDASNLVIPDYPTPNGMYMGAFQNCKHLVYGPQILLKHLSQCVFANTFNGCNAMQRLEMVDNEGHIEPGALASTFWNCSSLLNTPIQNITIDEWSCYALKCTFYGCTSMMTAPSIKFANPQNKVVPTGCMYGTFAQCNQLITAPTINNTIFSNQSMYGTFAQCDKLVNVQPTIRGGFVDGTLPYEMVESKVIPYWQEINSIFRTSRTTIIPSFSVFNYTSVSRVAKEMYINTYKDGTAYYDSGSFRWYTPDAYKFNYNMYEDIRTRGHEQFKSTFEGCTSLAIIPQIFITPADESFNSTFKDCISIRHCPDFGFTDLDAKGCLRSMFEGCYTLVTPPSSIGSESSKIGDYACYRMFKNCKSLVTPPELPITELVHNRRWDSPNNSDTFSSNYIYKEMFMGCASLTTSPDLLSEGFGGGNWLGKYNYDSMFEGCSSLTQVRCHLLTGPWPGTRFMTGAPSSGMFYAKAGTKLDISSFARGWTVIYEN